MLFVKNASYDDFAVELEKNLQQAELAPLAEKQSYQEKAVQHLLRAAALLDDLGLEKQASVVTKILECFAWEVPQNDPATSGLTPEKMVSNLEQKGWVFNADDGEIIDVVEADSGDTIEMQPSGELEVTDDEVKTASRISPWPEGVADPYGEEQVDLDIKHILERSKDLNKKTKHSGEGVTKEELIRLFDYLHSQKRLK